ncbi:MAG TPA: YkgJ family cysteine cluster protein [Bacteroidia bacterium]|nr:YkgJ family cysteine cluster protein [Bacteroidia bacterium]
MIDPSEINKNRKKIEAENRKFYQRLKKRPPANIDEEVAELDTEVFSRIDCLKCANCCKTISPVLKERDIVRLSTHFKVRPSVFTEKYLFLDEDGDYVLKSTPCPFLLSDNTCSVYEERPFACRSYPHTGNLPLRKSWELVIKNSAVCPAVYEITTILSKKYGGK